MADSVFLVPEDILAELASSGAFQVLLKHLSSDPANTPCIHHQDPDPSSIAIYCTLHLLLQPIVHLHETCTRLAHAALCRPSPSELELAFRDQARTAFLWLSCFLDDAEAEDWMATQGCPVCVVDHILSSDSTVRVALAAALVGKARYEEMGDDAVLPDPSFFVDVLKYALDTDTFWGPIYFPDLLPKAERLCSGIQALISQAAELEILVSSPSPSPTGARSKSPLQLPPHTSIALKVGPMARRQQKLRKDEEAQILALKRLAWQVTGAVSMKKAHRVVFQGKEERSRGRSLTWHS